MGSWYTPADIARERKLRVSKVLTWIRTGELEAINLAEKRTGRPRWRISDEALAAFDAARSNRVRLPVRARRQRRAASESIQFF